MNDRLRNSIEVLQRAYLTEELIAGNCQACAVGNLVAASSYTGDAGAWRYVFCTDRLDDNLEPIQTFYKPGDGYMLVNTRGYNDGLSAIKATGYSLKQLARIEYAFESAVDHEFDEDGFDPKLDHNYQWIRLQAVLKVLFDIEGISYDPEVEQPFLEKALL